MPGARRLADPGYPGELVRPRATQLPWNVLEYVA